MRGGLGEHDGIASAGRHGDQGRVILGDMPPGRDGPGEIRLPVQRGAQTRDPIGAARKAFLEALAIARATLSLRQKVMAMTTRSLCRSLRKTANDSQ